MTYQRKTRWTPSQENIIRDNYHHMTDEQLAAILGRTLKAVRRKRERMGLPKCQGRGICKAYVKRPGD